MTLNKKPGETKSKRISRKRKVLISRYATAAASLYGVISINEFVEVFNNYEALSTTADEVSMALKRLAQTDDVEYSISGDILSGPEFQPHFIDYEGNIESIRESQKGKTRYLPRKKEFLRYVDISYREPEKPYTDLKAYILKHELTTRGDGIEGVDGDLLNLNEMIRFGVKVTEELVYFIESGYHFRDEDEMNAFTQLVMNVHNNTRTYDNNGFSPIEIFGRFEQPSLNPLPIEPIKPRSHSKVSRNALCPCGSGLKYKKCHGK